MQDSYRNKSVTVIGGGLAGLSAAVFLAEKGFKVKLFEASPKFGGRVYSFFDKASGLQIDNGQHILASWYHNTFDYLKIIGSYEKLSFQKQLEVTFADNTGKKYRLKASKLPPPLHLAGGIMGYDALGLKDKLSVVRLVNIVKKNKIAENELKSYNTDWLLTKSRQTSKAINFFWKPFIIAVFNAEPQDTSALMFADMIRRGFIEKGGSELVLPKGYLSEIFVEPAVEFLKEHSAEIFLNNGVTGFRIKDDKVTSIISEDNTEFKSDYYISAVPFFNINKLFKSTISIINELSSSPIVNIHLKFDKEIGHIFHSGFAGLLGTSSQWVFKVKNDQVCVVISSARRIAEKSIEDITETAKNDLISCFPELKQYNISASRVLKETRATFVPDSKSLNNKPGVKTNLENLFLAGDWTNTGLPATIEGAVKSGKTASNEILNILKS